MTVSPGPKSLIKLVKSDNRNDYHRGGIVARGRYLSVPEIVRDLLSYSKKHC